jgi:uncharacterized protein YuzE
MSTPFVTYDAVANALYLRLTDHAVAQSIELSESVYLDLDEHDEPVGLEVLYAQGPLPDALKHVSAGGRLADLLALVV